MKELFPIKSIDDLHSISNEARWQYFEKLVAFIFEKNGFDVEQNKVVSSKKGRRQYDVVAERFGKVFIVECKKWKKPVDKKVIEKHIERCRFYEKHVERKTVPVVVTLKENPMEVNGQCSVIPVLKLNTYLNSF